MAWLRRVHRWAGLLLALPMIVLALTGSLLTLEPLLGGSANAADAERPVALIVAVARQAAPADFAVRRYRAESDDAAIVEFAAPGHASAELQVVVDTVSLAVLARGPIAESGFRWVHGLHESLLLGPAGRGVVGWCGVGLLLLGLSGLPLWWPAPGRWRAALLVARGTSWRRLSRDLHGFAGFWALGLLLVQSITGVALGFPQTARALAGLPAFMQPGPRGAAAGMGEPDTARPDIARIVAAARQAVPGAVLQDLRIPGAAGRPVVAILRRAGERDGAPAAFVTLDARSATVLSAQDPRTQKAPARLLGWLRALHAGGGLGIGWRLAIFVSGLSLSLLPLTGFAMWLLRRRGQRRMARQRDAAMAGQQR